VSIRPLFALMAISMLVGCANDPAPTEQLRLTEQAIQQAQAVGAADDQPELARAQSKLTRANADMVSKSFKDARMQAEQSELDARLAEARVLSLKSEEQINQLNTRLNRLRKQLGEAQ